MKPGKFMGIWNAGFIRQSAIGKNSLPAKAGIPR